MELSWHNLFPTMQGRSLKRCFHAKVAKLGSNFFRANCLFDADTPFFWTLIREASNTKYLVDLHFVTWVLQLFIVTKKSFDKCTHSTYLQTEGKYINSWCMYKLKQPVRMGPAQKISRPKNQPSLHINWPQVNENRTVK